MTSLHPNVDSEKANNSHFIIIGAHDSSGGAGLLSDFKAASALRCDPKVVTTHITAQTQSYIHNDTSNF